MKKYNYLLTIITIIFSGNAFGQCAANDSTAMGDTTVNDVYYSCANKVVKTVYNKNWHMAFSVQGAKIPQSPARGVSIRINSGGNGTKLRKLSGAKAANWRTIDTAGFYTLPDLYDSDSTWDLSAFTRGYPVSSDPYNFIWGEYDMNSHGVFGNTVFVLYNEKAGWYKKVFIKKNEYDTLWNFIVSNIDNSDSVNITFLHKNYSNRMFAYYNAETHQMMDREPAKTSWDMVWTRYVTNVSSQMGSGLYTVVGVLSNPAVSVEQNNGKKCNEVWLTNRNSKVDPAISAIGYDWKTFNGAAYDITDTFVYFVHAQDAKMYKLTFKSYSGSKLGKSTFNLYEATTGIKSVAAGATCSISPNPASEAIVVHTSEDVLMIRLYNMQGQLLLSAGESGRMNISSLETGCYIAEVTTGSGKQFFRILKE